MVFSGFSAPPPRWAMLRTFITDTLIPAGYPSMHDGFAPICHPNPLKEPMDASVEVTNPGPRVTGHSLAAWTAEARELFRLAVPMAATQLAQMIILATDTVMLGHFSKEALAAGPSGNTVFFFIWLMGPGPV